MIEKQMSKMTYFKEYLCFEFPFEENHHLLLNHHITFAEGGDSDVETLPSVIIDQINSRDIFFLLDWKVQSGRIFVFLKELNDSQWIKVNFNVLPEMVAITEGRLYAISGGELVIQEIYKDRQRLMRIGEGKIVSVKPSMVKYQGKEGEAYEAGISIYFFSETSGYLARHFSLHSQLVNQSLKNVVNMVLFKKYLEFAHFQVILPNLFALVFLNDSEFCVFNLHTWQIEESTRSRLICNRLPRGSEPVIRWRQHLVGKQYDYGLFVAIGIGSNIEIHFICLKYLLSHAELFKDARLDNLINGNFINWHESIILPDVNISIDGHCLDIAITKRGITYYSKPQPNSQISNCSYIDLNSAFPFPPMLTQQAIIWRKYYQDKAFDCFTDGNRFFVPNRYPFQFVLRLHERSQYEQMRADLLNAWRKQYKFKGIVTYNEEMLIVRAGSINAFRVVNQELYAFQHFSQEKLVKLDKIVDVDKIDREVQNLFLRPTSEYEECLFHSEADRPTLKQRRYKMISEENYQPAEDAESISDHKFQLLMRELQQIMGEKIGNAFSTMNVPQFQQTLTCNQLYDRLNYYHLIANSKAFRLSSSDLREYSKEYELYSCAIKLISYFYELLERSQQHYLWFENSLIGLFVDKHRDLLSSDIDTSVYSYIKLLFENLFPVKKSNYANSQINAEDVYDNDTKQNAFIEFLVEKLITYSNSTLLNRHPMIRMMREQLGNIVKIGLLDMKSLYFSNLWKNVSLFKALLLGGSQHLDSYFCQYLLKNKNNNAGFLEVYKSISPYMLQEDINTIENQLFFNLTYLQLVPDMAVLSKSTSHVESELDSHPATIALIKQDILSHHKFNNLADQEKISNGVLRELEDLSYEFDEKRWMRVNGRLGQITFSEEEKYLEYYEQAIAGLVRLFNSRVSIEGWKPNEQTQRQALLVLIKQKELMEILDGIEHFFGLYKQQYTHVYEQAMQLAEESGNEILREHAWQMLLLKERFITDTSHLMLMKDDGLLCCTLTIHMLKLALSESFSHSLEQTDNLIFFWLKWVQDSNLSIYQAALYIETIFLFSREEVKQQLNHHEDLNRRLTSIYSTLSNEVHINYAFFELVKGSNSSTN